MNQNSNKFVYITDNIKFFDEFSIEKNDIGIITEQTTGSTYLVFIVRIWQKFELEEDFFEYFDVTKTGDGFDNKICNICHKLLPTINFAKNQNAINNRSVRRPSCQACRKQLEGKDLTIEDKRIWEKKKPHNEPFKCPICNKGTIAGITCKVVLDHNHITGEVRGWICDSCNTGLGRFKDDVALLKKAIEFLE